MSQTGAAAWIAIGATELLWPAIFNGYPIVFSDTGGFLEMGLTPTIGWDKPFVYGPILAALSLRLSLFGPVIAQALLVSFLLWRLQSIFAAPRAWRHVATCTILALATPAAWFTSTLMPDILAPVAALALSVGAVRRDRWAIAIAAVAIASHLSHLIVAFAVILSLYLLLRRLPLHALAGLILALVTLVGSNLIAYGRLAVSPYGAVFALARLIADGPGRLYLDGACPTSGYILCAWRDRLTDDSDQFLWDPNGPFWADPAPLPEFAAQASEIVRDTVLSEPLAVMRYAYRNTATQLALDYAGDTLGPDYLAEAVRPRIARWFPVAELERFDASRQLRGELVSLARSLNPLYLASLAFGGLFSAFVILRGLRQRSPRADLAALILVALAANAFATGALSKPHDRYQARICWILLLPVLLRFDPDRRSFDTAASTACPEPLGSGVVLPPHILTDIASDRVSPPGREMVYAATAFPLPGSQRTNRS